MKAVWYEKNGPPEVLQYGDLPDPVPGPGEVRVRIAASGVNPSDWKSRSGAGIPMRDPKVIPHQDGSGVIDMAGEGVPASRIGQRVWLYEAAFGRPAGTAAEFTVQPARRAVPLPDSTSFAEGACLGVPAMTAHRCVFADGPVAGQTVLVQGGAGAVGLYAVQMAKLGQARVIATVSTPDKAALAAAAGADHTVDYRAGDAVKRILELNGGRRVDRIIEVNYPVNFELTRQVLDTSHGVTAVYGYGEPDDPRTTFRVRPANFMTRFVLVYTMPEAAKSAAIADITAWLEQGRLKHHIGPRFPLARTADAHRAVEVQHVTGRVIVDVWAGDR
jgi:NADPH2:quinone reductase